MDVVVRAGEELPQAVIDRRCDIFDGRLEWCILHGGNKNYDS